MIQVIRHWLSQFCVWLEQTPISQSIQTHAWVVPSVQTIHILAIAVISASALMIDLRLIGVLERDQSLARVSSRYMPFVWWPLLVLLLTGSVMIIGEPARSLMNAVFQIKVTLITLAIIVTLILQSQLRDDPSVPDQRWSPRVMAIVSIALWVGVICAGRWIAYYT